MSEIRGLIADFLVWWAFRLDPNRFLDQHRPSTLSSSSLYDFYKAYFEQKQRNMGKDPEQVLREALR